MEGCAAIPRADSVAIPTLNKYQGKDILAGHPFEMLGAIQNVRLAREAMKKAGRPVTNRDALKNPECLDYYEKMLPELQK